MEKLTSMENIGRGMSEKLAAIGIDSGESLKALGAEAAFAKLKARYPQVCLVHLYALEGAVCHLPFDSLSESRKKELKAFSDSLKNQDKPGEKAPLFQETVKNWEDWGRVFQSKEAFAPLAREIFRREGLPFAPLTGLTPGTNGVFRSGPYVVKIFFPKEAGPDPRPDFENEAAVCGRLAQQGVPTPALTAQGVIEDAYTFYYLITRFFPGKEAGPWLASASTKEQAAFVGQLKSLLAKLNQPAEGLIPPVDLLKRAVENPRLQALPPNLREEMAQRAKGLDLRPSVLVHGDLTGENLLVDAEGKLTLIDCADACLAPAFYELAPIVFELFQCREGLLRLFAGEDKENFVEQVLDAVCLHDFGAHMLRDAPLREGLPPFESLMDARRFLLEKFR